MSDCGRIRIFGCRRSKRFTTLTGTCGQLGHRVGNRFDEALKEARDVRDREFIEKARRLFADRRVSVENYAELFKGHGPLISGDITPGYSTLPPEMAATVTGSFPEAEIVFLPRGIRSREPGRRSRCGCGTNASLALIRRTQIGS